MAKNTYKQFHLLQQRLLVGLKEYCKELDTKYYIAKRFLYDLGERCYYDKHIRVKAIDWLSNGGTLKLQDLFFVVFKHNDKNILDYNAFALLDTVIIKVRKIK